MRGGKEVCNGSPLRRYAAISWLFGRAILSLRLRFSVSVLALSVTFGDSSPTEGRLWHVGQVHAGRAKHDVSGTVVLRCQDSRQLDKVRCPEAAALCSKARPFTPRRAFSGQAKVARPAKGSPFGGNGDDRRQWRKQGGAVGAAASRMRAAAKQTLGAATRPWRAQARLRGQGC